MSIIYNSLYKPDHNISLYNAGLKRAFFLAAVIVSGHGLASCTNYVNTNPETPPRDITTNKLEYMNSLVSIFEIPASDISRAVEFYQHILDIKIEKINMPEIEIEIFPYEGQPITGVIMKAEGYNPSADGVTIYLNGGDNLQVILDKVVRNGGKILVQKTPHADNIGFFALFLDSEGNKIGLHSPN